MATDLVQYEDLWLDVHAHLIPPSFAEAWNAAPAPCRDGMPGLPPWSLSAAVDAMDRMGVRAAAVSVPSPGVALGNPARAAEWARRFNTESAEIVSKSLGRLGLLACLPLSDGDAAIAEIEHWSAEPDVHGFVLFTNYDGRYLGDAALRPVLAELARRRAVVLLHPTSPRHADALCSGRPSALVEFAFETTRAIVDLVLSGALAENPELRLIIPHAGGSLSVLADRVALLARAFAPTGAGSTGPDVLAALRSLYYDLSGPVLTRQLAALLGIAEPEHLLYGTDLPFMPPEPVGRWRRELADTSLLTPASRQAMGWDNAAKLFPRLAAAAIANSR
ncbi:amidohydrolase family protein [Nocardia sp. ET3-3]|uniref:6-methylsalicylate decarboxylase n=1 Tax=Nocardia terrae TaxID=2675851 RepID=A0A7K1V480_9NOCA|nr:amidohydrolase family protein [Nocardia terrae]MVU81327.1 amidohydrolase family protein [Nocardia terrae]